MGHGEHLTMQRSFTNRPFGNVFFLPPLPSRFVNNMVFVHPTSTSFYFQFNAQQNMWTFDGKYWFQCILLRRITHEEKALEKETSLNKISEAISVEVTELLIGISIYRM